MLSNADNERVTRTDAGTPGGNLMRRYWQPVALSEELKDHTPIAVSVLGEALVLFRDETGKPALIGRYCPHRRVDLSYGRVEAGGLRCLYHGWVMGSDGSCLEQPGEPATSNYKQRVRHPAYPCQEAGQIIFGYLGEGHIPMLPKFEYFEADPSRYFVTKQYHACNYLQGLEGYVDPQHLSFLHRFTTGHSPDQRTTGMLASDSAPQLEVEETEYGFRIYSVRNAPSDQKYVRITNFILPNCGAFSGDPLVDPATGSRGEGYSLNWAVPIDDHQHFKYVVNYRTDGPIDRPYMDRVFADIDRNRNYTTPRDASNRYQQDRASMDKIFSGMGNNFFDHDKFAVESMGSIVDRSKENLGLTDRAIIVLRRQLLAAIAEVCSGGIAPFWTADPDMNLLRTMVVRAQLLPAGQDPRTLVPAPRR